MVRIETLSCDIETYSSVNLQKSGVYKYCESDDFEILLFGYSVNGGEVQVVDLASGETIPDAIVDALMDDSIIKWVFNAMFERICFSRFLGMPIGEYLDPTSWKCSMVWSAYMGLPLSLVGVGAVLGLEKQKLTEGKDLIRYFCTPCSPTKTNGGRARNRPQHDLEKWDRFKDYNLRDVETEMLIQQKLSKFPVPETIWTEYHQDQEINDRGISLDLTFVKQAIAIDLLSRKNLEDRIQEITQLENPNSIKQIKGWLGDNGLATETLGKKAVAEMLKTAPESLGEVLSLRQQLAKSSIKKYTAMENVVCHDNRARGMFQFLGASRTGRFSGRNIQLQNLPQNHMPDLEQARILVRNGNIEVLTLLYDSVPEVLSELIRTAFVPRDGMKFIVADFSAIEARVLSWLAGERWRMDVFEKSGDIYCETASKMFHCNVVKHGENGELRQQGKQAELSCLAKGQLVLTNDGLVPIEKVTLDHKLWDGENWVSHEGVVFKGEREVITYDGLTATADHLVWVEGQSQPVQFGIAAASSVHLTQTGNGGTAIRLGEDYFIRETMEQKARESEIDQCKARLYDIRNAGPNHRFTVSGKLVHNCGYGGSVGALKAMGALESGMHENELKPLVDAWRQANPNIVRFWWAVDRAVKECIKQKIPTETHGIHFTYQSGFLFITLPSGRRLVYVKPRIGENRFGGESVTYEGVGGTKKWERIESYGPKFVENIVQAISRDILCFAMETLRNCTIVAHVHDEIIIEADKRMSLSAVCEQMGRTPPWAKGLLLRADGYECQFYKKD